MIPKIIHYCWFGGKDKPESVINYLHTWQNILSDYEIKEWNESNFDYKKWKFCREAYAMKRYAFVSDVCRMYVLNEFGGIYLDTDIEVLKSFDSFLHHTSFGGIEAEDKMGTGVIGAEPHTPWVKAFLDTYKHKDFINSKGRRLDFANTDLLKCFFKTRTDLPVIYPIDFFCAKLYTTGELRITDNTVCVHRYASSWHSPKTTIVERLHNLTIKFRVWLFNQ